MTGSEELVGGGRQRARIRTGVGEVTWVKGVEREEVSKVRMRMRLKLRSRSRKKFDFCVGRTFFRFALANLLDSRLFRSLLLFYTVYYFLFLYY